MPLLFDEGDHRYTWDGLVLWSVTQLLHLVGLIDFSMVPSGILETARVRGTLVHRAIHFWNEHDLDVGDFLRQFPALGGYLQSWIRLMDSGRLTTVLCEHRVANLAPRYAGTFDWLGLIDGQAAMIDFATGNPEDAAKHLQLAGYVLASKTWATMPGEEGLRAFHNAHPYIARYAVRLDRDGGLPTLTRYDNPRDFSTFLLIASTVNAVEAERAQASAWEWER